MNSVSGNSNNNGTFNNNNNAIRYSFTDDGGNAVAVNAMYISFIIHTIFENALKLKNILVTKIISTLLYSLAHTHTYIYIHLYNRIK